MTAPERLPDLPAPRELVVEVFEEGGQSFAILEWPAGRSRPRPVLTPAEGDVLELLLDGLSNAQIALRRRRSARTVAHQVDAVFRRLGVGSRSELFARCSGARPAAPPKVSP